MWKPNFPYTDIQPALLRGYHRSLCVYSIEYRGTRDLPGIVLGLDKGGSCKGRAMRVDRIHAEDVLKYLHEREMKHQVYYPKWMSISIPAGRVKAYCFVVKRDHEQYTGKLGDKELLKLIRQGRGKGGACLDYLYSTIHELNKLGILDGPLHQIIRLVAKS